LYLSHLLAEDRDRLLLADLRVLRDVQRQAGLSHARTGGQDDEVRRLKAAEQRVQLCEPGRDAQDLAAVLVQVFEPVVRLAEEGGQGLEAADRPALADLEQDR